MRNINRTIIQDTAHRPWDLPKSSWIMTQRWHDLLFMHWPLPIASLRPLIPRKLALDTFDGKAWIAVVPFHMSGIRMNGFPEVAGTSAFPELNVRTYVTDGKKPGVFFFSLDAANWLAVMAARMWYHLPYFHAQMSIRETDGTFHYKNQRKLKGALPEFSLKYAPVGEPFTAPRNSLDYWFTERYCLYASRGSRIYRAEIHHAPWQLQKATATILTNTLTPAMSIALPDTEPLLHFSRLQEVLVWNRERL